MIKYKVKKEAILFVANFRDQSRNPRYKLGGVCFAPGGVIVATDGHVLGRELNAWSVEQEEQTATADGVQFTPSEGVARPEYNPELNPFHKEGMIWNFTKDDLKLIKADKSSDFIYIQTAGPDAEAGTLIAGGMTKGIASIDATYPMWQRVIPTKPAQSIPQYSFNPELLEKFKYQSGKNSAPIVKMEFCEGEIGCAKVLVSGRPDFLGLIMPCRWAE